MFNPTLVNGVWHNAMNTAPTAFYVEEARPFALTLLEPGEILDIVPAHPRPSIASSRAIAYGVSSAPEGTPRYRQLPIVIVLTAEECRAARAMILPCDACSTLKAPRVRLSTPSTFPGRRFRLCARCAFLVSPNVVGEQRDQVFDRIEKRTGAIAVRS
jgi:hypothetical protein